jgi:hypothetical protein
MTVSLRPVDAVEVTVIVDNQVDILMASREGERSVLRLEERTPVLDVVRVTRDQRGRPVEALHIVADGARNVLVYDGLPIAPGKY